MSTVIYFLFFIFYWANRWWCNAVRATHEWWCNTPDSKGVLCLHTTLRTAEHMLNYCHCHWYFRQTDKLDQYQVKRQPPPPKPCKNHKSFDFDTQTFLTNTTSFQFFKPWTFSYMKTIFTKSYSLTFIEKVYRKSAVIKVMQKRQTI